MNHINTTSPPQQVDSSSDQALPVVSARSRIEAAIRSNEAVVIVGETGSGKTTQVPQFLLPFGAVVPGHFAKIAVTQPRRVAAISVAERVAQEVGTIVPEARTHMHSGKLADNGKHLVGYRVRFADATRRSTRLVFCTDGMLLREAQLDPSLAQYDVVMLDEAHERGLNTDILFAVVKRAMAARRGSKRPLRSVIMSATLNVDKFASYFGAHSVQVPGRQFPVAIHFLSQPVADPVDAAVSTVLQLHTQRSVAALRSLAAVWQGAGSDTAPVRPLPPLSLRDEGDMLVFLSGRDDIETAERLLRARWGAVVDSWSETVAKVMTEQQALGMGEHQLDALNGMRAALPGLQVVPLYAALSPARQMAAFAPPPPDCVKVILATNIAETSITIPGIRTVVDTGYVKVRTYIPGAVADTLLPEPVSQAQAAQRTGRAGRISSGACYRLYTQDAFQRMDPQPSPEISRVALATPVLALGSMGESVQSLATFPWLDPPSKHAMRDALVQLVQLKALQADGAAAASCLTGIGKRMAALPLPPQLARFVLAAANHGCVVEALTLSALLTLDGPVWHASKAAAGLADAAADAAAVAAQRKRKRFTSHDGDHVTLLNAWCAFERLVVELAGLPPGADTVLRVPQLTAGQWNKAAAWCADHGLQFRSLRRAAESRSQLATLCVEQVFSGESASCGAGEPAGAGSQPKVAPWGVSDTWHDAVAGKALYTNSEALRKAMLASFFTQVAFLAPSAAPMGAAAQRKRTKPQYLTAVGRSEAWIHPSSVLSGVQPHPPCVVYSELVFTKKTYMRSLSRVDARWLPDAAPGVFKKKA